MKAISDEEIQKLVESGNPLPEAGALAEYQTYQQIFKALKTEPGFDLPDDFSNRLVGIIGKKEMYRQNLQFYFLLTSVSALALFLGIAAVAFMNKPLVTELLNFIWKERWITLCCITLFLSVQISDQLVKKYLLHDHYPLP